MTFNTYFRLTSYATIAAAALAVFVAGGVSVWLGVAFAVVMVVAWQLEDKRWQLSERVALLVILLSIPIFYLDWRILTPLVLDEFAAPGDFARSPGSSGIARGSVEVAVLAHLIFFLSAVKLLQRKADRDWFFLYLISFFEVLLATGLTANPTILATLVLYLLCAVSTVIAFEIYKTRRKVTATQTRLLVPPDSKLFQKLPMRLWRRRYLETRRLALVSVGLLFFIVVLALPFFLIAPRTASSALKRGGSGVAGFIGFSDNVTLGEIGHLKGNDEIFMHVRIANASAAPPSQLRWRGVALDDFSGKAWKKSTIAEIGEKKESERGFFQIGTTEDINRVTIQTFFVEPVDTPVLFGAPRVVAVQGRLPFIRIDSEGSIQTRQHEQERVVYKVYSDTSEPDPNALRNDHLRYFVDSARYLERPRNIDPRIAELAAKVIDQANARNGYDAARAIESYLHDNYGYSLDLKASGPNPLSDFLFNVKAGHCEYFATAMAVMLRTQGVATRVVNGFLPGEYNAAAGAYTVRQSDAHSWVEVYFPRTNSWVTFDPTPPAGRVAKVRSGIAGALSKYSEALELMWFQYVVGYDKQEQRSLVTSVRNELVDLRRESGNAFERARAVLPSLLKPILIVLALLTALLLLALMAQRISRFGWRRGLRVWQSASAEEMTRIEFYERLLKALEKRGIKRETYQTPLEFAAWVGGSEAHAITNAYNRVRFGQGKLSETERTQIEKLLVRIEGNQMNNYHGGHRDDRLH
jgi:transglutaminase-like putative cysteine protease